MHSWAEKLKKLQSVQIRMAKLAEELSAMPAERQKARDHYASESQAVSDAQAVLKSQELRIRGLEGQIGTIRSRRSDFQTKSSLIKNNDEYRAAMLQIELCDKSISDLEDQQLAIMEEMDSQRGVIGERQALLKLAESKAEVVLRGLSSREQEIKDTLARLELQLPVLKEGIAPEFLSEYLRLRGSQVIPGTVPVLVPLEGDCCGGCHMRVTAQVKSHAMNGRLVCCPSCQCLLYWDD